jgi:hypothetical protein
VKALLFVEASKLTVTKHKPKRGCPHRGKCQQRASPVAGPEQEIEARVEGEEHGGQGPRPRGHGSRRYHEPQRRGQKGQRTGDHALGHVDRGLAMQGGGTTGGTISNTTVPRNCP